MSDEKTYRSVGMAKIDDNFRISLNIKWLGQIIVGVGILVMGYLRIENRIGELERRVELADTNIEDLVSKHIEEEDKKITQMQEQLEWYQTELNLNPLSWGKKKRTMNTELETILTRSVAAHAGVHGATMRRGALRLKIPLPVVKSVGRAPTTL